MMESKGQVLTPLVKVPQERDCFRNRQVGLFIRFGFGQVFRVCPHSVAVGLRSEEAERLNQLGIKIRVVPVTTDASH